MINIKSYTTPKNGGSTLNNLITKTIINNTNNSYNNNNSDSDTIPQEVNGVNIWGQYHNHTADITGSLSDVEDITGTGTITMDKADFKYVYSPQGSIDGLETVSLSVDKVLSAGEVDTTGIITETIVSETITNTGNILTKSLAADGEITAASGSIDSLTCDNSVTTPTLSVTEKATITDAEITNLIAKVLTATDITVDNLTVTKAAHFFELIIDKIKSVGGQVIISPANAKLDYVKYQGESIYFCGFKATDGNDKVYNMFEVGDQVICQTFNAAEGSSFALTNKYYWATVMSVSSSPATIDNEEYHTISLNFNTNYKDSNSNGVPEVGDNIVVLGNKSDEARQSAITIGAYDNAYLDSEIKAPFFAQYTGINDFNLSKHRTNVLSLNLNEFKGNHYDSDGVSYSTALSELKQTDSEITATVKETQLQISGDNVIEGVGNGQGWVKKVYNNKYSVTKATYEKADFSTEGFTFTIKPYDLVTLPDYDSNGDITGYSQYKQYYTLWSPIINNVFDTYTLSFAAWQKSILIYIYDLPTDSTKEWYKTEYLPSNRIAYLSTSNVYTDGSKDSNGNPIEYDGTKLRYSPELDRYYFTFTNKLSTSRFYGIKILNNTTVYGTGNTISTAGVDLFIQSIMLEAGTIPHKFNFAYATNQSQMFLTPTSAGFMTTDASGNVATIGTYIDGVVKLTGNHIQLEGLTTINDKFKVNEDGTIEATDGVFNGTIKATNFYHKTAIYGYTNRCWYYNGQYFDSDEGLDEDRIECCGYADIVLITNNSFFTTDSLSTTKRRHLTLPRAEDFEGKLIEVYDAFDTDYENATNIFVKSVNDNWFNVGAYNGNTLGAAAQYQILTGGYGKCWKYLSVKISDGTFHWLRLTENN